jgi:hypothetical protein
MSSTDPELHTQFENLEFHTAFKDHIGGDMVAAGVHMVMLEDEVMGPKVHVVASITEIKKDDPEPGWQPHSGMANFEILSVTPTRPNVMVKFRHDHPHKLPFRITYLAVGIDPG